MSDVKISTGIAGVEQLRRALKLTDAVTRTNVQAAIRRGTEAVVSGALQRVHRITGELAGTIRAEYSENGLVGYAKAGFGKLPRRSRSTSAKRVERLKARRRRKGSRTGEGAFAPVVERGDPRRHHRPHPFMIPAFEHAKAGIISDTARQLNQAVSQVGSA